MSEPQIRQTATEDGRPVKRRVPSVTVARDVFQKCKDADAVNARLRARLKAQADGAPPYQAAQLEELGLKHMTNVNFLEMRSILDQKAGQFFELFHEVPTLVEFSIQGVIEANLQQPREMWERIISEEFTSTVKDWGGFLPLMDRARRDADLYGLGVAVWPDEHDWRPVPIARGALYPEPRASVSVEQWETCAFSNTMKAGELMRIAEDDKAAEDGWNVQALRRLMVRVFSDNMQTRNEDGTAYPATSWENIQQMIRNNDPDTCGREFDDVMLRHVLVKEVDGDQGVSHLIFSAECDPDKDEFLCEVCEQFENMAQALWLLPFNFGDGYIQSVRGLASMVEPHCDLSNRYLGQVFDAGKLTGSLILQANGPADAQGLQIVRAGPTTLIPHNVKAIQGSFAPPLAPLVDLRQVSLDVMRNNTGVWRQHGEAFRAEGTKTARQVVEEVSKEARLEKANVAFDYEQLQKMYREMWRRMLNKGYTDKNLSRPGAKEVRDMLDRCKARGVPEELLDFKATSLRVVRAIGMGSWGVKMDITNQLLNIRGLMDEAGRKNALRDYVSVRVGYQNVDRYISMNTRDSIPSNEHSHAMLENNDLVEGRQVAVGSDQTHVFHVTVHAELMQQAIETVKQSEGQPLEDPASLIRMLTVAIPHVQTHLQYLEMDPSRKEFVAQAIGLLEGAEATRNYLIKQFERMQKQQQAQQQAQQEMLQKAQQVVADRETELKAQKIAGELDLQRRKLDSLNEQRVFKAREQASLNRERAQVDAQLKREAAAVDAEVKRSRANATV
jgi:hypothetical protein